MSVGDKSTPKLFRLSGISANLVICFTVLIALFLFQGFYSLRQVHVLTAPGQAISPETINHIGVQAVAYRPKIRSELAQIVRSVIDG